MTKKKKPMNYLMMSRLLIVLMCCTLMLTMLSSSSAQTIDPWTAEGAAQLKVDWLTDVENLLVVELNKARTDPARYAREYIEPELATFLPDNPKLQRKSDGVLLSSKEGAPAVKECIAVMKKTQPMGILTASAGISKAAHDHGADMQRQNFFDHKGSDQSDPFTRMNRYGKWESSAAENIAAGRSNARDILLQLLVDDGVPSRGHRENILSPEFTRVGVAITSHPEWGWSATIDFAGRYSEK